MSNLFFTSDTHWNHEKIRTTYCPDTRIGDSIEEMNEQLIARWNSRIGAHDVVYHIGDVSFSHDVDKISSVLSRLNGVKHLILGNHDDMFIKYPSLLEFFESSAELKHLQISKKKLVVMCHYPILSWRNMRHGSYHLYGHCHGGLSDLEFGRSFDVGIDARPQQDMMPWAYEEIDAILSKRPIIDPRDVLMKILKKDDPISAYTV